MNGAKEKSKGKLIRPILAEIEMKPCEIRDLTKDQLAGLTEDQIQKMITTDDSNRQGVKVEDIEKQVPRDGFVDLEPTDKDRSRVNRVSMTEEELTRQLY